MGDFFVDDQFYEHPKALFVGEDAADLYVRGLAWAHRANTGLIPKSMVQRLTSRRNASASAAVLCETAPGQDNPLWYDEGNCYRIHDWEIRNAKSIAKREQSRVAAKERWRKHAESNASAYASAYASASIPHSARNADAMPYQPRTQGTSSGLAFQQYEQAIECPENAFADESTLDAALEILYRRRPPPHTNPEAHRAVTIRAILDDNADTIAALSGDVEWTPEKLADWIEPVYKPPKLSLVAYVPKCATCNDRPLAYDCDDNGFAIPCPDCENARRTA